MKIKNIATAFVTAAAIAIASCGTVSAFAEEGVSIQVQGTNETINYEFEPVDIYFENGTRGKDMPSKNSVYKLNINSYKGYIESFSYGLFTNYWFTGKDTMTLTLTGWSIYDYFTHTSIKRTIHVEIYEQGVNAPLARAEYSSEGPIYNSYTFTAHNLDPNKKYTWYIGKTADTEILTDIQIDIS